jgi:hypothetical protein
MQRVFWLLAPDQDPDEAGRPSSVLEEDLGIMLE